MHNLAFFWPLIAPKMNTIHQLHFELWSAAETVWQMDGRIDRQMRPNTIVAVQPLWAEVTNKASPLHHWFIYYSMVLKSISSNRHNLNTINSGWLLEASGTNHSPSTTQKSVSCIPLLVLPATYPLTHKFYMIPNCFVCVQSKIKINRPLFG